MNKIHPTSSNTGCFDEYGYTESDTPNVLIALSLFSCHTLTSQNKRLVVDIHQKERSSGVCVTKRFVLALRTVQSYNDTSTNLKFIQQINKIDNKFDKISQGREREGLAVCLCKLYLFKNY